MITATNSALQTLNDHFVDKDVQPIRVHVANGGCGGPQLALALDELRDGDQTVTQEEYTFLIHQQLAEVVGDVTIDIGPYGLSLASEKELPGGGGCGGCGRKKKC